MSARGFVCPDCGMWASDEDHFKEPDHLKLHRGQRAMRLTLAEVNARGWMPIHFMYTDLVLSTGRFCYLQDPSAPTSTNTAPTALRIWSIMHVVFAPGSTETRRDIHSSTYPSSEAVARRCLRVAMEMPPAQLAAAEAALRLGADPEELFQ